MCGRDTNATDVDSDDQVPTTALAAALVMIAAGIIIVLTYGCRKKLAWQPEKTYVLHTQPNAPAFETIELDEVPARLETQDDMDDSGVEGLDNGLSETLQTSLLAQK